LDSGGGAPTTPSTLKAPVRLLAERSRSFDMVGRLFGQAWRMTQQRPQGGVSQLYHCFRLPRWCNRAGEITPDLIAKRPLRSLVKNRYKRGILDFGQFFDKKPNEINVLWWLALSGGCKAWVYIHVKRGFT